MPHRYVDALVESKSDIDKLLRHTEDQLARMVELHEQYEEMTRRGDRIVITRESHGVSDEFEMICHQLGKYLEDELAAVTHTLWQKISRPDEERKFNRMRNALLKLPEPFLGDSEDYYSSGAFAGTDPEVYVEPTLKTLRYLKNYWHRIERYQKVERLIKHGPFTIINQYGYQPGEYERELGYFDEAANRIGKMGFNELLYGEVALTTQKTFGGNVIGLYISENDTIMLAVDWVDRTTNKREKPVPVLIHEFGHRLWRKFIPAAAKGVFVVEYGWISGVEVAEWWNDLVNHKFSLRAVKKLHPEAADEIDWRWKRMLRIVKRENHVSVKLLREILTDTVPEEVRSHVSKGTLLSMMEAVFYGREWYDRDHEPMAYYKPRTPTGLTTKHVTWYGKTNPEEEFCERFMFWCMGWEMDEEMEAELVTVLRQANVG